MTDTPPPDPADHTEDFAHRWVDRLENLVEGRMYALNVPEHMIGSSDYKRGVPWRVFFPHERDGGGTSPGERINVDSGVLNPELHPVKEWARARLRDRGKGDIAQLTNNDLRYVSLSYPCPAFFPLPVSDEAKRILRAMAR